MLANGRQNRENASRTSQGSRKYSAHISETGSRYKEKAQQYYNNFNGKPKPGRALSSHNGEPMTPQQDKHIHATTGNGLAPQNFYIRNAKIDENTLKLKSIKYLDKKGIITNKTNKRYYRDNDIPHHLKVDKKQ